MRSGDMLFKMMCAASSFPLALASQAVHAQSGESGSATPEISGVDEILVTAQKRSENIQDVPISIDVVSGDQIANAQIVDTRSLGQLTPTLTFTAGFGPQATSFNIRGLGSYVYDLAIQPAVSVVIDGVPLARNSEFVSQLGDIDRIEVLSGPQGTLFGKNSTGGAINVVRKMPTDDFEGNVEAQYSAGKTDGTELVTRFSVSGPLAAGVNGRLAAFMLNRSDYIRNLEPGAPGNGGADNFGAIGKLAVEIGADADLLLTAEGARTRDRGGANVILQPLSAKQSALLGSAAGNLFTINQDDGTYTDADSYAFTADLTVNAAEGLTLKSISSFRDNRIATQIDVESTPAAPDDTRGWDIISIPSNGVSNEPPRRRQNWDYFSQEFRAEYTSDLFDVTGGFFYQHLSESLSNFLPLLLSAERLGRSAALNTPGGPSSAYPYYYTDTISRNSSKDETFAGFADVVFHATPQLEVFGGVRVSTEKLSYDYKREDYFLPVVDGTTYDISSATPLLPPNATASFAGRMRSTDWAGRAGARYAVTPDLNVYGAVSRGFIGTGADLSRSTAGSPADTDAAFLAPSTARNIEIGVKGRLFDRRLRFSIAAFHLKVRDLQAASLIPGTAQTQARNAGTLSSKGVEFSFDALPVPQLSLGGGFSYNPTEFSDLSTSCYPGQTAAEGCIGGNASQDGKPGLNAPEFKLNLRAEYRTDLTDRLEFYIRPAYSWQSSVDYQLNHDPLTRQDGYGLFDLTLGLASIDRRFDVSIFGKNLTNERYCDALRETGIIARVYCQGPSFLAQRTLGVATRFQF